MLHALGHKDHQNVLSMFCMKGCQLRYVETIHNDYSGSISRKGCKELCTQIIYCYRDCMKGNWYKWLVYTHQIHHMCTNYHGNHYLLLPNRDMLAY